MLKGFLTSSEGSTNGKHKGEDDRNADQGEVHIEFDVVAKSQEGHD